MVPAATPALQYDRFWGAREERIPTVPESRFWGGRPRSTDREPFLLWAGRRDHRIGLLLMAMGLFSVFVVQLTPLFVFASFFQLVLGAPIFEEFLKFGLALVMVSGATSPHRARWVWWPIVGLGAFVALYLLAPAPSDWRNAVALDVLYGLGALGMAALLVAMLTGARWATGLARVPMALAVGAAFGVMEHNIATYAAEDDLSYLWRYTFHAVAAGLSMTTYTLLERERDARLRWLAVGPAILIHYLNNAGGIALAAVIAVLTAGSERALGLFTSAWPALLVTLMVLWFLLSPALGGPTRRWARRLTGPYLAPIPARWRRGSPPHASRTPATHR